MEKAIEIKRRAQRCIQNGDLDGALGEYEKLVAADDSDPYNFVLLADLHYKKGDHTGATRRYLEATAAYEKAALYKNAIAVCKKMMRLSLSPTLVLQRLALLHGLDGLATEAALYYMQHAELLAREDKPKEAAASLRSAFEICPDNIKALERLAEVQLVQGDKDAAVHSLTEAYANYQQAGAIAEADRCRARITQLQPGAAPPLDPPMPRRESAPPAKPASPPAAGSRLRTGIERRPASADSGGENGLPRLGAGNAEELVIESTSRMPRESGADAPPAPAQESMDGPGLQFDAPALEGEAERSAGAPVHAAEALGKVEKLLALAQEQFRSGHREVASAALVEAARAYEDLGQHDSAATIYRSLSKSAHAAPEVLMLWLKNCETRRDLVEAAQVACELGDLALNEGDADNARSWFQRAAALDATNPLAYRRLQRLGGEAGVGTEPDGQPRVPVAAAPPAAPAAPGPAPAGANPGFEPGRVEVAVGRGEAVTFDLGSLVSEFQRGIEAQISGDAQGHYDLGMTYREMGLLEQAVEAFRNASTDPGFVQRCAEMIGRCLLDQGRFDEAAQEFITALEMPGLAPSAAIDLRYQLGLAHEAGGRVQEALAEFERVYAAQASYPDVALKIRVLRKTLESL